MKKEKLQLKSLKVKSFVTLNKEQAEEVKGGVAGEGANVRAMKKHDFYLPRNIRVHAWTVSEIRNDDDRAYEIKFSD